MKPSIAGTKIDIMNKQVPNIISFLRILLSLLLLLVIDSKLLFVCVVLVIGITDVADGYIARKYNLVTKTGAQLDSVADLLFFMIIFIVLVLRYNWVVLDNSGLLSIVVAVKAISAILSKIKQGKIIFIHTIANKLTVLLIFFSIMILPFEVNKALVKWVFIVAILAAIEELGLIIKYKEINPDQKSIFRK